MFIVKSRKEILWGVIIVSAGLCVGSVIGKNPLKTFIKNQNEEIKIVVDAGHGQPDGGAVGINGSIEEKINLEVSKKLSQILKAQGISVIMTRETNDCLADDEEGKSIRSLKVEDMKKRLEIIKKSNADLFVSIHMNHFPKSDVTGLRLFYDKTHPKTKNLADLMQIKMAEVTNAKMYAVKAADQTLFLMKNPPVPAILIECGFISNKEEEKKLNDEDYQSRIAWAIAKSIKEYFKL